MVTFSRAGGYTDGESEMDRDSFGEHLRQHQDDTARHSLDDPFSHDESYATRTSANEVSFENYDSNVFPRDHNEHSHSSDYDETDTRGQQSTASWFSNPFVKHSPQNTFMTSMKQTLRYCIWFIFGRCA
jgi:hypothetical protein